MGGTEDLLAKLHPLERKVLPFLHEGVSFEELVEKSKNKPVEVMRALQWMQNKGIIAIQEATKDVATLDKNGIDYAKRGLPETRFLKALTKKLSEQELAKKADLKKEEVNVCIGLLRRKNAITIQKENKKLVFALTPEGEKIKEHLPEQEFLRALPMPVDQLTSEERFIYTDFLKRKNIVKKETAKKISAHLTEMGRKIIKEKIHDDYIDKLDIDMLKSGSWRGKKFRSYDVLANVPKSYFGKKHFENEVIDYVKKIWLELGFQEMKGTMMQSAFWDLDCLFVPQDHPAREMQDTFYLKNRQYQFSKEEKELAKKIKAVHENGWQTGSKGWQSSWNEDTARKMLLRTHTTVLSAQTISKVQQLPAKFFSVGKVFRNEALDWKHSFEFYQVEGIVIDEHANLQHLKGYLREFYAKMGYDKIRMRPSHFPYTEPSLEVDVFHPVKKEWVELGGSGIFRPEVVKPLLGKDVPVLAWGLGLGRLFDYFDIKDIRDINRNDVKQLRSMKLWLK
ncbi:phenylalanine--tRNA ligase subunit alpha [Candidatus Woesearchaeota archaeon]|nr:MAG: phenylalanine--tRNA ligase subunit alpha [Candidatus Woesearchaeota archaeon]